MVDFGNFLKTWSLRSNSVTRQVNFIGTKIIEKCQNWNIQMRHFRNKIDLSSNTVWPQVLGFHKLAKMDLFWYF